MTAEMNEGTDTMTSAGRKPAGRALSHVVILLLLAVGGLLLSACNLAQSAEVTEDPTPDLPRVEILFPANNQQVIEGAEFDFDIVARDENPGIARVELYIDEELINEARPVDDEVVPVFRVTINWLAQGEGLHVAEVIAYRPDGTRGDPALLTVEVLPREAGED